MRSYFATALLVASGAAQTQSINLVPVSEEIPTEQDWIKIEKTNAELTDLLEAYNINIEVQNSILSQIKDIIGEPINHITGHHHHECPIHKLVKKISEVIHEFFEALHKHHNCPIALAKSWIDSNEWIQSHRMHLSKTEHGKKFIEHIEYKLSVVKKALHGDTDEFFAEMHRAL